MKTFGFVAAFVAGSVSAFPHMDLLTGPLAANALQKRATAPQGAGALPLVPPPFNAKAQYVSTTGVNKVWMRL